MSLGSQLGSRFRAEFTARVLAMISGTILIVILSRLLNPDGYGLLFLAISVLGVANLFSKLGIGRSAARYISEYKETDPGQIPHILRFTLLFNLLTITVVSIAVLLSYRHISELIGEPNLAPFLLIGILYIVFSTLTKLVRSILQGFENIEIGALIYAIDRVSRLFFAIGLVFLGYGALGALVGYVLSFICASSIGLFYIYFRHYRTNKPGKISSNLRRRIVEYTVPLTATSVASVLDKHIDTILVGFFLNPAAVGFYTIGKQVLTVMMTPMAALRTTLSPTYKSQKEIGKEETATKLYEEGLYHGLLLYIPGAAGLIILTEPFVELVFGNEYLGAVPILQVLAIYAVLQSVTSLTSEGLDFLGRARERSIVLGITAVLNVFLNIIFIPQFGVVGAAIATIITYSIYTFANLYIMSIELPFRARWLLRHVLIVSGITIIMSIIVQSFSRYITGFATLFGTVLLGIGVWSVLVFSMGLLDIKKIRSFVL